MADTGPRLLRAHNNTNPVWWKDQGLLRLNMLLGGVMLGSIGFGYDSSLIGGLLANPEWFKDLNLTSTQLEGVVIAAKLLGAVGGFIPGVFVIDRFGRRAAAAIANVAMIGAVLG